MTDNLRNESTPGAVNLKNFTDLSITEKQMVLTWRNSELVRNGMYNNEPISWQEHSDFIKNLKKDETKLYFLAFIESKPVAVVYFTDISMKHKHGVYGIYLRPDRDYAPNTGDIMREVVLKLAFEELEFNTLNSEVLLDNKAAYIFNVRGGFVKEGVLRSYISREDRLLDVVLFGMLKQEYFNHKSGEK